MATRRVSPADVSSFKLHVDETGRVWCGAGDTSPAVAAGSVQEFLDQPQQSSRFRIVAAACNSSLIAGLFSRMDGRGTIELCTPRLGLTSADMKRPQLVILRARGLRTFPSVGGWHLMQPSEHVPYLIADAMARSAPDSELVALLDRHPAVPYWFFPAVHDRACLARVVGSVRDPRWYVNDQRPDRLAPVMNFLGMDPKTIGSVHLRPASEMQKRAGWVLRTWFSTPPSDAVMDQPRHFLWRRRAECLKNGDLRACKLLVMYLMQTWIEALSPQAHDPIFDPAKFFKREQDQLAFQAHMSFFRPLNQAGEHNL